MRSSWYTGSMDYQEKTHITGRLLEFEGRYFYILEQKAGMLGPGRPMPIQKSYDAERLMTQAIEQYPGEKYFTMNTDYTMFLPDAKHEWLGLPWEKVRV